MDFQPSLFGFIKPKKKVPISAARVKEVMELIAKGDGRTAAQKLRDIRDRLEHFESRL